MKTRILLAVCLLGTFAAMAQAPTAADENKAYTDIFNAASAKDSTTTPAALEGMVDAYLKAGYPNPRVVAVEYLMMRYYSQHQNYPQMLVWGEKVLEKDPNNIPAMASLAGAIPAKWHDTDIDGDQRLAQAEGYDNKIIQAMNDIKVDTDGATIGGRHLSPADADNYKLSFEAAAYASLGHIAFDRKKYDDAVKNYKLAVDKETSPQNKSTELFTLALAQENLKQYTEASASLNQAAALAGTNANMQTAIKAELDKIKKMAGGAQ